MNSYTSEEIFKMKSIREDKLRLLVESGSIKSALVIRNTSFDPDNNSLTYMVVVECESKSYEVHTQKGVKRNFKTIDAVDKFLVKNGVLSYSVTGRTK